MTKILELVQSRKFWAMFASVAVAGQGYSAGVLPPREALAAAIAAVLVWVNAQSRVDAARVQ